MSESTNPSTPTVPAWEQAIITKCEEAGVGIMAHVLSILMDRGEVGAAAIEALTAEDIEEHYDAWIAPAINNMERALLGDFD